MANFPSRRARFFDFVLLICVAFAALTALAMPFYPGGTQRNRQQIGYAFTLNFFSDLGRSRAWDGAANPISSALFSLALILAGAGLIVFFSVFAGFFWTTLTSRVLGLLGAVLGSIAGAAFVGVALVRSDFNSPQHIHYVLLAFRSFFGAVLPFSFAILGQKSYPKLGAWIFLMFAALLAAYIALLSFGPRPSQPNGLLIQVVGQKLIVYASIVCIGAQAVVARRFLKANG